MCARSARRRPRCRSRRRAAHVGVDDVAVEHDHQPGHGGDRRGRPPRRRASTPEAAVRGGGGRARGARRRHRALAGDRRGRRHGAADEQQGEPRSTRARRSVQPQTGMSRPPADDGQHREQPHRPAAATGDHGPGLVRRGGSGRPRRARAAAPARTSRPATPPTPTTPVRPPPELVDPLLLLGGEPGQDQPRPHAVGRRQRHRDEQRDERRPRPEGRRGRSVPSSAAARTSSLEKNPTSGGTPASDSRPMPSGTTSAVHPARPAAQGHDRGAAGEDDEPPEREEEQRLEQRVREQVQDAGAGAHRRRGRRRGPRA